MNMSKETILEEFEQKYGKEFMIKSEPYDYIHKGVDPSFNINDIKQFLSQAISQTTAKTREETIKEERLRASKIVEEMMEDSEHWQPIARRIISGDILNKLKN